MSRESRMDRRGAGGGFFARGKSRKRALWSMAGGGAAFLVVLSFAAARRGSGADHPTPRDMDHSSHVVPAANYAEYPRVAETYRMVAAVPHLVDGVYCYCRCSEHSGHYSLLDCFSSDHAARCDVCLSEATMTYRMSQDGHDLKAIRAEIDGRFGT